ncbi:MAG: ATP-binding protein, partial [Betaproteobacteria bacterium]
LVIEMAADVSFALDNDEKERLRKQADMEVRRLNVELESRVLARTAELAAANMDLEAFAYSVSHDLRAPLRGIVGFSRILRDDYGDKVNEPGRHYLDRICHGAERMGALIDDLLMLSSAGRQSMQRAPVNLSEAAVEILNELLQGTQPRKIETRVAAGCVAMGDARLLHVLLQNLLQNAVKYSGKNPHALIEFGCESIDGAAVFHVRDNGAGFDMAHVDRLFLPFQRLHRADEFEGTGIGLATCARVVHRHGGKIWAESELGRGATFRFTLPAQ